MANNLPTFGYPIFRKIYIRKPPKPNKMPITAIIASKVTNMFSMFINVRMQFSDRYAILNLLHPIIS
jgi:hypothetical protein